MAVSMTRLMLLLLPTPQVALESLTVRGGAVSVAIVGDGSLRHFADVSAVVRLGHGYHSMHLDLTAQAHARDPSADKCTMMSPKAQRHIRRDAGPQARIVGPPSGSILPAPTDSSEPAGAAPRVDPRVDEPVRGSPTGGRVQVKLSLEDLMVAGKSPDLRVRHKP